ncbi:MAG: metalloregulator ArsR/SmtB family transcription factor [Bacteroidota bacterium]
MMRIRTDISSDYITEKDQEVAEIANALAHPVRVALVRYLAEKNKGKGVDNFTCNKDLVALFGYAQSTISQHVKILKAAGLFMTSPKDKFVFYRLNFDLLEQYTNSLLGITK